MTSGRLKCKNETTLGNQVATTRTLLRLSTEVLIEILGYLPAADMISVQQTCRTIHDIVAGTTYLQYVLHADMNSVGDFLLPNFSYSERLELLRRHEQSWDGLHFDLFTKCDCISESDSDMPDFTLQDCYLIYRYSYPEDGVLRYEYTDLCSAARNEDLRWVHVTLCETGCIPPFPCQWRVIFAVDHDLVVAVSNRHNDGSSTPVRLTFFEFTTGAPHPLSSTHTVTLPQHSETPHVVLGAEVLGDHILVVVWVTRSKYLIYLVSWKTGAMTLLRESLDEQRMYHNGRVWAAVINSSLVALIDGAEHRLEICKLEIPTLGPYLQTLCFFDLPPLVRSVASLFVSGIHKEYVPTSRHHAQSRTSRGCHLPFYSHTIGTIALRLQFALGMTVYHSYALIISVPALLSAIPTGVRNMPWVDWAPSSADMFKIMTLKPAGPFWITSLLPLEVRRYDLRHTQSIQSTAEDTSPIQPPLGPGTIEGVWNSLKTHISYRDIRVPAGDRDIYRYADIVADREWVIVVKPLDEERFSVAVYHAG